MHLAKLRMSRKLTQRELAAYLSLNKENVSFSPAVIALYELGLRTPNVQRAKIMADFFGVSIEELFFGPSAHDLKAKLNTTGTDGK